jgi:hypothetical protein
MKLRDDNVEIFVIIDFVMKLREDIVPWKFVYVITELVMKAREHNIGNVFCYWFYNDVNRKHAIWMFVVNVLKNCKPYHMNLRVPYRALM